MRYRKCSVFNCHSNQSSNVQFFKFPKLEEIRKKWVDFCKNDSSWLPGSNSLICILHFDQKLINSTGRYKRVERNSIPTIYRITEESDNSNSKKKQQKMTRIHNDHNYCRIPDDENNSESQILSLTNYNNKLQNQNIDLIKSIKVLKKQLKSLSRKFKSVKKSKNMRLKSFNSHQCKLLFSGKKFSGKWDADTVKKAIEIRASCGPKGYNHLKRGGYPIPSISVINLRLRNIKFESGVLDQFITFLKENVHKLSMEDRRAGIYLDEMSIVPGESTDPSTNQVLGRSNFPGDSSDATHALVIMICGLRRRWKQVVAYFFTGNSTDGMELKQVILEIIDKCETAELFVDSLSSDMGPNNISMWNAFGISVKSDENGNYSINNKIPHPRDQSRFLYFYADVPHLDKNLAGGWRKIKKIEMSDDLCMKYKFPLKSTIDIDQVRNLYKIQNQEDFKAAPRLKESCLDPKQYEKMKVGVATNLMSNDVAAGLVLNEKQIEGNVHPTAWFCKTVFYWFKLMTSRTQSLALSKSNLSEYQNSIKFLKDFMFIIINLNFGKTALKPFQKGILISTKSCLEHHEFLLQQGYNFVLTSRLTQDCLENLFSQVRARTRKPSCSQFKQTLRLLVVSNYVSKIEGSNYEFDENGQNFSFIDYLQDKNFLLEEEDRSISIFSTFKSRPIKLSETEKNHVYYAAGYILQKIKKIKRFSSCKYCSKFIECNVNLRRSKYSKLVYLKNFKETKMSLTLPPQLIFNFFLKMEIMIKNLKDQNFLFENNCGVFFESFITKLKIKFTKCHDLQSKIIKLYFSHRLRIAMKPRNRNREKNEKLIY